MAAEDFFSRWSKKKDDANLADAVLVSEKDVLPSNSPAQEINAEPAVKPLPTQEDVDKLNHDSDYSAFMSKGVDESVKRSAMKKLFSDPHFNIMDGLDIYIDDYNKFEPISPAMLASLNHAKALLDPLSQLKTPFMNLLQKLPEEKEQDASKQLEIHDEIDSANTVESKETADTVISEIEPTDIQKKDYAHQEKQEQAAVSAHCDVKEGKSAAVKAEQFRPGQLRSESSNIENAKAKPDSSDV